MIELDDPMWRELKHAYGDGADIPERIRRIEAAKTLPGKFWDDLANTLCHQWSIGSASIAAFPHLVRLAAENPGSSRAREALKVASMILCSAIGEENRIPNMEQAFLRPFRDAVARGRTVLAHMIQQNRKQSFGRTMDLLAMIAAFSLRSDVAGLLWELQGGETFCPRCEERVSVHELYSY